MQQAQAGTWERTEFMKISEKQLEQVNDRIQALIHSNSFPKKKISGTHILSD